MRTLFCSLLVWCLLFVGSVLTARAAPYDVADRPTSPLCDTSIQVRLWLCDADGDGVIDSLDYGGQRIGTPGVYVLHFVRPNGCDSVITAYVERYGSFVQVAVAPGDTVAGVTITTDTTFVRRFPAAASGCDSLVRYRVTLLTSSTHESVERARGLRVYPTPHGGSQGVTVALPAGHGGGRLSVVDAAGRVCYVTAVPPGQAEVALGAVVLPKGVYSVTLARSGERLVGRGLRQ